MSSREHAINTLNAWFASRGDRLRIADDENWAISEYRDAYLVGSGQGRRTNLLYLVGGSRVGAFTPAMVRLDDAYATIVQSADPSGDSKFIWYTTLDAEV